MILGAVVWPDRSTIRDVNTLRQRYDPHFHLIAPHITVIFPTELPLAPAQVVERIRPSLEGVHPFTVEIRRLSTVNHLARQYPVASECLLRYPNAVNTLFLLVDRGADNLIDLKARINRAVGIDTPLIGYPPYLTVGQTLTDTQLEAALGELAGREFCYRFRIDCLAVLSKLPNGRWKSVTRVPFSR